MYREEGSGMVYSGAALMYGGYTLPALQGDYPSVQLFFKKIDSQDGDGAARYGNH